MGRNLVQEVMDEIIDYGGVATPRGTAYLHALECAKSKGAPNPERCADLCCMMPRHKALTPDERARLIPYRKGIFD